MKEFIIVRTGIITFYNVDETNRVIKSIEFEPLYPAPDDSKGWCITVELNPENDNKEITTKFHELGLTIKENSSAGFKLNTARIFHTTKLDTIITFFKLLEKIDPLHPEIFTELLCRMKKDKFYIDQKSKTSVNAKLFAQALRTEEKWPGHCSIGKVPYEILNEINNYAIGSAKFGGFFTQKFCNETRKKKAMDEELIASHNSDTLKDEQCLNHIKMCVIQ